MNLKIKNFSKINGTVKAPSSKSYSHRAVILASLAEGKSKLFDVLYSEDVLSTIRACEALGAKIDRKKEINKKILKVQESFGLIEPKKRYNIELEFKSNG
jgi:5-enolpyruvylshikimate-3-phosphate synthase